MDRRPPRQPSHIRSLAGLRRQPGPRREIPEAHGCIDPSAEPQLRVCEVLDGRFLIREATSRSGMATTYRAEDMFHGRREVAIKVPLMWVESDSACLTRFLHEEE